MRTRAYETARRLTNILLSGLLAARLLAALFPALRFGLDHLEIFILLLCGLRFVFLALDLAGGAMTWRRAIFPVIVLLAVVAIVGGHQSQMLVKVAAGLAEVGILGFVIAVAMSRKEGDSRPLEERLIDNMQRFVPMQLARFMVTEMLIVWAAATGPFRRGGKMNRGFSYTENSFSRILPVLLLFTSPPDIFMMNLILRALNLKGWLWSAALTGSDIYLVIWAYGYLVTMRERPHEIAGHYLRVYKGIFGNAAIALDTIQSAVLLPTATRGKRQGCADLSLRGTPKIEIRFSKPARVVKWFMPDPAEISCVTVSADDPNGFCRAIEHHRAAAAQGG